MTMRSCRLVGLAVGTAFTAYTVHFNWTILALHFDEGVSLADIGLLVLCFGTPMILVSFIAAGLTSTFADVINKNEHYPESHGRDDAGGIDGL